MSHGVTTGHSWLSREWFCRGFVACLTSGFAGGSCSVSYSGFAMVCSGFAVMIGAGCDVVLQSEYSCLGGLRVESRDRERMRERIRDHERWIDDVKAYYYTHHRKICGISINEHENRFKNGGRWFDDHCSERSAHLFTRFVTNQQMSIAQTADPSRTAVDRVSEGDGFAS